MTTRPTTTARALRGTVAVATTLVLTAAVGGAALAAWSFTGTGSGTAAAGTTVALTTTAATAPAAAAYPGGPPVALAIVVSNPNGVPVRITSVALDSTRPVVVTGASGTCTAPPVAVSVTGLSSTLAANASNVPLTVPGALTLGASTPSGCQGATFTVPVVLTGQTP